MSDSATPWTVAYQAPWSMGFTRQEYWSGLPFPPPGDLPNPGIEPGSPALQTDALLSEPLGKPTILLQLQKKCLYVPVPLFLKLTSLRGHSGCWAPLAPVTAALEARGGEVQPAQDRRDQQHCPAVITNYSGLQVAHPSSASLSVTWLPLKGKETPGRGQPCPCRQPTFT